MFFGQYDLEKTDQSVRPRISVRKLTLFKTSSNWGWCIEGCDRQEPRNIPLKIKGKKGEFIINNKKANSHNLPLP